MCWLRCGLSGEKAITSARRPRRRSPCYWSRHGERPRKVRLLSAIVSQELLISKDCWIHTYIHTYNKHTYIHTYIHTNIIHNGSSTIQVYLHTYIHTTHFHTYMHMHIQNFIRSVHIRVHTYIFSCVMYVCMYVSVSANIIYVL